MPLGLRLPSQDIRPLPARPNIERHNAGSCTASSFAPARLLCDARDKLHKQVKAGLKVLYTIAKTTLTAPQLAELEGAWGGSNLSTLTRRPAAELTRLLRLALPRLRERADLKLPETRLTDLEADTESLAQALSELQRVEGEQKNARDAAKAAQTTFVTAYRKLVRVLRLMWGEDKVRATLWHFEHKRGG